MLCGRSAAFRSITRKVRELKGIDCIATRIEAAVAVQDTAKSRGAAGEHSHAERGNEDAMLCPDSELRFVKRYWAYAPRSPQIA